MKQKLMVLIASLSLTAGGISLGHAAEGHVAEALKHAKQAESEGKHNHARKLVKHAKVALQHAEAAEKQQANPHVEEGITHLNAAIESGKDAKAGTAHVGEAITHLQQAK